MKLKNVLFLITANVIVFFIVFGLIIAFVDLSNPVRLATFILMMMTIMIPSVMILVFRSFSSPSSILTFSLFIINLIATITLFSIPVLEIKPLIITEVIIFGLYLAFMFVALGESSYEEKSDKEKSIPN